MSDLNVARFCSDLLAVLVFVSGELLSGLDYRLALFASFIGLSDSTLDIS